MTTYDAGSIRASADLNRDPFIEGLRQLQRQGDEFARQTFTARAGVDILNARRELEQLQLLIRRIDGERLVIRPDVDTGDALAQLEALRLAQRRLDEQMRANSGSATRQQIQTRQQTRDFNLMRVAVEQLAPPLIPLAGGFAALAAGAVTLGLSGVAAFKGIQAEVKANTAVGQQYMGVLQGLKSEVAQIERSTSRGFLTGAQQGASKLADSVPAINIELEYASRILGDITQHLTGGLAGGFSAFTADIRMAETYVDSLAARFEQWATGPGGANFAKALGDDLQHAIPALEQIATLLTHLVAAGNPIGTVMLDNITSLARAINSLPVGVLQAAASAYLTFRTVMAVTSGIQAATVALRGLAGAETAAAAGAGAAGRAGGASRAGMFLGRAGALAAGLYVGGAMVGGLARNSSSYNQPDPNSYNTGAVSAFGSGVGNLLTGHLSSAYSDWFGQHRKQQISYANQVEQFRQAQQYFSTSGAVPTGLSNWLGFGSGRPMTSPVGGYDQQGNFVNAPSMFSRRGYTGPTTTAQQQQDTAYQGYYRGARGATSALQGSMSAGLAGGSLQQAADGYNAVDKALQKQITSQSKLLALGGPTVTTYRGVAVGANTYAKALAASNGDQAKATALIEATVDAQRHNQTQMDVNQQRQLRINQAIGAAAQKYGLTADQVDQYSQLLGINAGELGRGEISQRQFVAAIGAVADAVSNGNASVQAWTAAVAAFSTSADTAADRGALIGARLQAANGDAIGFQNTMVQAAVANQQFVTDLAGAARGLINLKTGTIDYHNAAAAPLLADLQNIQTANMNAASAVYQHELATKGAKQAADDAYHTYVNNTRTQLIDEAEKLGMTADQAGRFADKYFGLAHAKDIKKQIEAIGADKTDSILGDILSTLLHMAGLAVAPSVGINDQASGAISGIMGQLQALTSTTWRVNVSRVETTFYNKGPSGSRDKGGTASAVGSAAAFGRPDGTIPPNTRFTVGEGASHTWEYGETDAAGRTRIYSNRQAKAMGVPAPVAYAGGSGEGGGFTGVKFPTPSGGGGSSGSGSSGSSSPSSTAKEDNKWREFRGMWYQGLNALHDAMAIVKANAHPGRIESAGTGKYKEYAYRGQSYDTLHEAQNARTEYTRTANAAARLYGRQLDADSITTSGSGAKLTAALKTMAGRSATTLDGWLDTAIQQAQTAQQAGGLSSRWVKWLQTEKKQLDAELRKRDAAVDKYKAQQQKVKDLQASEKDAAASYKQTAMAGFDIGTSGNGYAAGISASLDKQIADATKFRDLRDKAKKLGLDPKLLQQIISEGPQQGGANLEAIVNGGASYVKSLDDRYKQLGDVAGQIGTAQASDDYGKQIADAAKVAEADRKAVVATTAAAGATLRSINTHLTTLERRLAEAGRAHGKKK